MTTASPPSTTAPVLAARSVFRFRTVDGKQHPVVRDVSFALRPAEFVAVMGPSGSGKSTLLHMLAGLDKPSAGQILLNGDDLAAGDEEYRAGLRRKRIGFIFQFFNLLPDLTVDENVTLPLRILGDNPKRHRARIDSLLQLLGVEALKDRLPQALSGGEMQRVSIARALSTQPPLVLADEPTGNLDSAAGTAVMQLLTELNREGRTIVLVTHDEQVAAYAQRELLIRDGVLAADRPVTARPATTAA
jgi:putative ABC transport system ATP-binding protein